MEDKRIQKTKKYLKKTLIEILGFKPFEKITVKEICEKSQISRMTFYAHYNDKYDLVDDISKDMIKIAQDDYRRLQKENNAEKNSITSYCNFLGCILNLYYKNLDFFSHVAISESPYLNFSFNKYVMEYLKIHAQKRSRTLKPKYDIKKIAGFLCCGFLEFVNESNLEKCSPKTVIKEAVEILRGILESEVLTNND